jgi:hypothetical protein
VAGAEEVSAEVEDFPVAAGLPAVGNWP